jgi:hypothetical protein
VPNGSGFRNSDRDNFVPGDTDGIFSVDGVKVGLRVCYEVRFPEYFRELFVAGAQIACVAFCDTAEAPDPARYALIKGHLATRAVEKESVRRGRGWKAPGAGAATATSERGDRRGGCRGGGMGPAGAREAQRPDHLDQKR